MKKINLLNLMLSGVLSLSELNLRLAQGIYLRLVQTPYITTKTPQPKSTQTDGATAMFVDGSTSQKPSLSYGEQASNKVDKRFKGMKIEQIKEIAVGQVVHIKYPQNYRIRLKK